MAGKCPVAEVRRVRLAHIEADFRETIMGPRIFASLAKMPLPQEDS